jgi:hypothetical protein
MGTLSVADMACNTAVSQIDSFDPDRKNRRLMLNLIGEWGTRQECCR